MSYDIEDITRHTKIYLACPYSSSSDEVMELRYQYATQAAAQLMADGYNVFSPITHSHPVAHHLPPEKRLDHGFWLRRDFQWIDACDELWVLPLPGWGESIGVREEIMYASQQQKEINFMSEWVKENIKNVSGGMK